MRGVWMMNESYAQALLPVVKQLLNRDAVDLSIINPWREEYATTEAYFVNKEGQSFRSLPTDISSKVVMVIPVCGPIVKYGYCGDKGSYDRMQMLSFAENNPNIVGTVLMVDSGGGSGEGLTEFCQLISECSKPVVSYVFGMAASAAYWIACASHSIQLSSAASEVGSIGAFCTLIDPTGAFEAQGFKIATIYATQSEDKNDFYRDWTDKDKIEKAQAYIDEWAQVFIDQVTAYRPNIKDEAKKGAMYSGQQAIDMGLADGIASLEECIDAIFSQTTIDMNKISFSGLFGTKSDKEAAASANANTEISMSIEDAFAVKALEGKYGQCAALFGKTGNEADFDLVAEIKGLQTAASEKDTTISNLNTQVETLTERVAELEADEAEDTMTKAGEKKDKMPNGGETDFAVVSAGFAHNQTADKLLNL